MRVRVSSYEGDWDRQQKIADMVIKYSIHPRIRSLALKLTRHCKDYDDLCEIRSIFNFVKNNIRYIEDVAFIDSYHSPLKILEWGQADCDDFTILTDSLLASIGFTTGAKIISKSLDKPFHHIYSVVLFPKSCTRRLSLRNGKVIIPLHCYLLPLDPSVKTLDCCEEVPHAKEKVFLYLPKHILEV